MTMVMIKNVKYILINSLRLTTINRNRFRFLI